MAKRRSMGKKELADAWKALPESDRRFYSALIILIEAIGDKKLLYHEPSASLLRLLRKLDRNALYSVIAECLYLLLDARMLERVKQGHREREAKKKKRISAPKKKSRTQKKPAPMRRTTRKGPSK